MHLAVKSFSETQLCVYAGCANMHSGRKSFFDFVVLKIHDPQEFYERFYVFLIW